jgi:cysteine desulfurase
MPLINQTIYFDHAATTPIDHRVIEKMLPFFSENFGNSSSIHQYGQVAEKALEDARETVAQYLNCEPDEIIFTSCGSESDNLALRGIGFSSKFTHQANHLLISSVEHHAISRTAQQLATYHGFDLEFLPVDKFGIINPYDVEKRIRKETALVSIIYANNEIGSINPIKEIGDICKSSSIPFHTDAVQAVSFLPINVRELNVDSISLGAHKFYGPKGIGVLYVRKGISIFPQMTGGNQERGFRAGTHNIPYIIGLSEALKIARDEQEIHLSRIRGFRDQIINSVMNSIPDTKLTGHPTTRLPNHASFVFKNIDGNSLLVALDILGYACSSGSACKTGNPEPSEVLTSVGLSNEWALGSLRITLGKATTQEHITQFIDKLPSVIHQLRT